MSDKQSILNQLHKIRDVQVNVESTLYELEQKSFEPFLLTQIPGFLKMGMKEVENYIETLWSQPLGEREKNLEMSENDYRIKQSEMVVYQFSLLCRLRNNETGAWDYINELYEDD